MQPTAAAAAACCVVLARFMKAAFTRETSLPTRHTLLLLRRLRSSVCLQQEMQQSHISDLPTRYFLLLVIVRFMKTSHLLFAFATQVPENLTQVQK